MIEANTRIRFVQTLQRRTSEGIRNCCWGPENERPWPSNSGLSIRCRERTGGIEQTLRSLRGSSIGDGSLCCTSWGCCKEDKCEQTAGSCRSTSLDLHGMSWQKTADCCFAIRNFSTTAVTESPNRSSLDMGASKRNAFFLFFDVS